MDSSKTRAGILQVLRNWEGPAGASRVREKLLELGVDLEERTVRYYLLRLDEEGMTRLVSRRRGRVITEKGVEELARVNVVEKVGFVVAKVDTMGYGMTFSHAAGEGTIISNRARIRHQDLSRAFEIMEPVFQNGLGMGNRCSLTGDGDEGMGDRMSGETMTLATVCSVTVNGILLHEGIPVTSRYGGLLEIRGGLPLRFIELIDYHGTSLDPLEAFIRAGMTRVRECARSGGGIIGASFREIPSVAVPNARRIVREMEGYGLGGVLLLGKPNQPLLDVPVADGRTGMIVAGGLNPVAALHEAGIPVSLRSLAALEEYDAFATFDEVRRRHAVGSRGRGSRRRGRAERSAGPDP